MQAHDINEMITNNMAQHGSVQNENLLAVAPVLQDQIDDGHESTGPLVLIGYLASEPVYRTTHTVAHHMEGYWPGAYRIHWPPLFPNIWLPECQHMQLDVTIRTESGPHLSPAEPSDDSEYDNDVSIDFGDNQSTEDDDQCDDCSDLEYLEEIQPDISCLDNIEIEWIIVDSSEEE